MKEGSRDRRVDGSECLAGVVLPERAPPHAALPPGVMRQARPHVGLPPESVRQPDTPRSRPLPGRDGESDKPPAPVLRPPPPGNGPATRRQQPA